MHLTVQEVLAVCEALCDCVSGDMRCILCARDLGVASRVVSSHLWEWISSQSFLSAVSR
jgi:hypothetical protein